MTVSMAISLAGLQASVARFDASARRIAAGSDDNLATDVVNLKMAQADYRANLAVLKTAERMMQSALDILA